MKKGYTEFEMRMLLLMRVNPQDEDIREQSTWDFIEAMRTEALDDVETEWKQQNAEMKEAITELTGNLQAEKNRLVNMHHRLLQLRERMAIMLSKRRLHVLERDFEDLFS